MKAWLIRIIDEPESTIVFAETCGKAKAIAFNKSSIRELMNSYTDITASRIKCADKMYNGYFEMDWDNPKERLFLVKELDFYCGTTTDELCEKCIANKYCGFYKDILAKKIR